MISCLPGTIRSPWCSCASCSPRWCPGTSGGRVCGIPTSWPPSCAIPSHSTSPGWSTVPPTCMETGPMTSTSALGRTHSSLWVPLVSRGEPVGRMAAQVFWTPWGFCGLCKERQWSGMEWTWDLVLEIWILISHLISLIYSFLACEVGITMPTSLWCYEA